MRGDPDEGSDQNFDRPYSSLPIGQSKLHGLCTRHFQEVAGIVLSKILSHVQC